MLLKRATGKWKIETKRILNPSPISKFVANSSVLFPCFIFLFSVPPFSSIQLCIRVFLCRPCTVTTRIFQVSTAFYGGRKHAITNRFSYNWKKIQLVGIIAIKIKYKTRMYIIIGCRCRWPSSCVNSPLWTTLRLRSNLWFIWKKVCTVFNLAEHLL